MSPNPLLSLTLHFSEGEDPWKLCRITVELEGGTHECIPGKHWKSNARTDVLAAGLALLWLRARDNAAPELVALESTKSESEAQLCAQLHDLWHSPRKRVDSHWLDAVLPFPELPSPLAAVLTKSGGRRAASIRLADDFPVARLRFVRKSTSIGAAALRVFLERRFGIVEDRPAGHQRPRRYRTRFFGRDDELRRIEDAFDHSSSVGLVGPAGAGKTRLAVEFAEGTDRFADGFHFVDLSSARTEEDVALVVAAISPDDHAPEAYLEARQALVVLDNCESVLDSSRRVAERIVSSCPQTAVLTTSIESLGDPAQLVLAVRPFEVPSSSSPTALKGAALRLFMDRLQWSELPGGLEPTDGSEPSADEISSMVGVCQAVGGLPLGIELAASAARHFPLSELAGILCEHMELAVSADRQAPDRHATLQSVVGWTFGLLREEERDLASLLALFPGGWTLRTLMEIASRLRISEADALSRHGRLVDLSIVRLGRGARFSMLQPFRSYAQRPESSGRQSAATDTGQAAARASAYRLAFEEHYLGLAESQQGDDDSGESKRHDAVLGDSLAEVDNLQGAAESALDAGRTELVFRFVEALFPLWIRTGRWRTGVDFCRRVIETTSDELTITAQVYRVAAGLEYRLGDIAAARDDYLRSRELAERAGDEAEQAQAVHGLGAVAFRTDNLDEAEPYFEEAVRLWKKTNDPEHLLLSVNNLAAIAATRGRYADAAKLFEEVVSKARALGDERTLASGLHNIGLMQLRLGNSSEAESFFLRSLEVWEKQCDPWGRANAANNLAVLALAAGNTKTARAYHVRSLEAREEIEDLAGVAASLEGFAGLALAEDNPFRCLQLIAAADALRQAHEIELTEENRKAVQANRSKAEALLPGQEASSARTLGVSLGWREAVALALESNGRKSGTG